MFYFDETESIFKRYSFFNRNYSSFIFLIYFNYTGILAKGWNWLFSDNIEVRTLVAPLGISFITFSSISYLTDIYRGHSTNGSLLDCMFYLTFFPKIVSGPIILWKDFQEQINVRKITIENSVNGLNRIMIGFAKKVILADSFGSCIVSIGTTGIDSITAFGTIVLYMLQIYYDFSGYSDIAIGLSNLLGFNVKENFNFPYRSTSISEFWRRWHISLGTWFRQYVYFPLGGSRTGYNKTLRNLAIVFVLTGVWHGAGWNYILWGFINCFFVLLERVIQNKSFYIKTPSAVKYGVTMFIVMLFWQFFRFQNVSDVTNVFGIALGVISFDRIFYTWEYYFDMKMVTLSIIGILGATILGNSKIHETYQKFISKNVGFFLQEVVLIGLFVISILFIVNLTYSPFIYFQY